MEETHTTIIRLVCLVGLGSLLVPTAVSATPAARSAYLTTSFQSRPGLHCLQVRENRDAYASEGNAADAVVMEVANGCGYDVELRAKSCTVEACSGGCSASVTCDGEWITVPADGTMEDAGDASVGTDSGPTSDGGIADVDGGMDAEDSADADTGGLSDTTGNGATEDSGADTTGDVEADANASLFDDPDANTAPFEFGDMGIEPGDFDEKPVTIDATFEWRTPSGQTGTFVADVRYHPSREGGGGPPCGCSNADDGMPGFPAGLVVFVLGLGWLRRRM